MPILSPPVILLSSLLNFMPIVLRNSSQLFSPAHFPSARCQRFDAAPLRPPLCIDEFTRRPLQGCPRPRSATGCATPCSSTRPRASREATSTRPSPPLSSSRAGEEGRTGERDGGLGQNPLGARPGRAGSLRARPAWHAPRDTSPRTASAPAAPRGVPTLGGPGAGSGGSGSWPTWRRSSWAASSAPSSSASACPRPSSRTPSPPRGAPPLHHRAAPRRPRLPRLGEGVPERVPISRRSGGWSPGASDGGSSTTPTPFTTAQRQGGAPRFPAARDRLPASRPRPAGPPCPPRLPASSSRLVFPPRFPASFSRLVFPPQWANRAPPRLPSSRIPGPASSSPSSPPRG